MAIQSVGWFGSVKLLDEEGSVSNLEYDLDVADATEAAAAMAQIVTDLNAITDALVDGYRWGQKFAEDTRVYPDGVEVEKRALITAVINGSFPAKYVNLIVPAPSDGIFLASTGPNSKVVDPNDTALRTYLAHFGPTGDAFVSDGERIQDPTSAGAFTGKKSHRGSRNG
jgi:hypothetical protein